MAPEASAFAPLREEWDKNPRLRLGAWLVIGIILMYCVLVLADWKQAVVNEYDQLESDLDKLLAPDSREDWVARQESARLRRKQVEERFWKADSRGKAKAMVQTWAESVAKETGLTNARIQVDNATDISHFPGYWQVVVTIESLEQPKKLPDLLKRIETNPQAVVFEKVFVTEQGMEIMDPKRFSLMLKALFKVETADSQGAAG